ncbi:unnamed protein product [Discosporangium mesarthrocarpum]
MDNHYSVAMAAREEEGLRDLGRRGGVAAVPWPADVLEAGARLVEERGLRNRLYSKMPPKGGVGAPTPFGRNDFRGADFGIYCIDDGSARFFDDAFSFNPTSGELLVHIADVQAMVEKGR